MRMIGSGENPRPLQLLTRVTAQVTESRELDTALQFIANALVDELSAVMVHLVLYTDDDGCPTCRTRAPDGIVGRSTRWHGQARAGMIVEPAELHIWPDGLVMVEEVLRTHRPLRVEKNAHDYVRERMLANCDHQPEMYSSPERLEAFLDVPFETVAFYPLMLRGAFFGVLCSSFTRELDEDEFACIAMFANQASVAIDRARLDYLVERLRTVRPGGTAVAPAIRNRRSGDTDVAAADAHMAASPAFRALLDTVRQTAATESTVLLVGETGTGKEVIARTIHRLSARGDRPLVRVNCGAIAANLIESELFGHERGAFTGALQRRLGRFEMADRGTLFLDELAELPLDGQVKLLRVLQEREFERVGSSQSIRVDVRLIAATNRDLDVEVASGRFREDLFYRVSVLPIRVPALRERPEDIPLFAEYFLADFHRVLGTPARRIADDALRALLAYHWPGNVRELRNVMERACVLARGDTIGVRDLRLAHPHAHPSPSTSHPALPQPARSDEPLATLEEHERAYLRRVLASTNGRIEGPHGAAAILAINPSTLRSRLRRLGIDRVEPPADSPFAAD
jgi:formate hydrogenlyase transcriptional activator